MRIDKDANKEALNRKNHKLDFSFADLIFGDPLALVVYDRFEAGDHRWHAFAWVGGKLLLAVYAYPDPHDEDWVRIISIREATSAERRRYEEGDHD